MSAPVRARSLTAPPPPPEGCNWDPNAGCRHRASDLSKLISPGVTQPLILGEMRYRWDSRGGDLITDARRGLAAGKCVMACARLQPPAPPCSLPRASKASRGHWLPACRRGSSPAPLRGFEPSRDGLQRPACRAESPLPSFPRAFFANSTGPLNPQGPAGAHGFSRVECACPGRPCLHTRTCAELNRPTRAADIDIDCDEVPCRPHFIWCACSLFARFSLR